MQADSFTTITAGQLLALLAEVPPQAKVYVFSKDVTVDKAGNICDSDAVECHSVIELGYGYWSRDDQNVCLEIARNPIDTQED